MRRLLVLALVFAALACVKHRPPPPEVAARISGRDVLYADFEAYVTTSAGEPAAGLDSRVLSRMLDRYLEEEALLLLARDRGIEGDARTALDGLLAAAAEAQVDRRAVADYYEVHQEEFRTPHQVQLFQILVDDRELAEGFRQEIADGAEFAAVAERAGDPTGGNQGRLALEDLPPAFVEVVERLEPGELSPVVEADYGFHVFLVAETFPEALLSLEEAEERILAELQRQALDEAYASLVAEALDRYDLAIHVQNLPFDYQESSAG